MPGNSGYHATAPVHKRFHQPGEQHGAQTVYHIVHFVPFRTYLHIVSQHTGIVYQHIQTLFFFHKNTYGFRNRRDRRKVHFQAADTLCSVFLQQGVVKATALSLFRKERITRYPELSNSLQITFPMPPLAPVTRATGKSLEFIPHFYIHKCSKNSYFCLMKHLVHFIPLVVLLLLQLPVAGKATKSSNIAGIPTCFRAGSCSICRRSFQVPYCTLLGQIPV